MVLILCRSYLVLCEETEALIDLALLQVPLPAKTSLPNPIVPVRLGCKEAEENEATTGAPNAAYCSVKNEERAESEKRMRERMI